MLLMRLAEYVLLAKNEIKDKKRSDISIMQSRKCRALAFRDIFCQIQQIMCFYLLKIPTNIMFLFIKNYENVLSIIKITLQTTLY